MSKLDVFLLSVVVVFGVFAAYTFAIWLPVAVYAEAECLREGYPKAHVTIGLERYCSNLDGAVVVKVVKKSN